MTDVQNDDLPIEYSLKFIKGRIVKEFLNILILLELTKRDNISGYDIIDLVNLKFSEPISPGTVYSTLYAIERKNLIYGETDGRKTVYKLTKKGEAVIEIIRKSQNDLAMVCRKIYEP